MKTVFFPLVLLVFLASLPENLNSQPANVYQPGVTLTDVEDLDESALYEVVESLDSLARQPIVRIVFNLGEGIYRKVSYPEWYEDQIPSINGSVRPVMGLPLDSYEWDWDILPAYSVQDVVNRYIDFVDYENVSNYVDIWEIGNEVNGDWLMGGNVDSVMKAVYLNWVEIKRERSKKVALTLYLNDEDSTSQYEMFNWVEEFLDQYPNVQDSIDYVFVSFYDDDYPNFDPIWNDIFIELHDIFPYSELGIGECGTEIVESKVDFIDRYYHLALAFDPTWFIGGYFWWYYQTDCVPYSTTYWETMNDAILDMINSNDDKSVANSNTISCIKNHPNPFNPTTTITYSINHAAFVKLKVFDILGREITTLVSEMKQPGTHNVVFNAENLASGIYFYQIEAGKLTEFKKMLLLK